MNNKLLISAVMSVYNGEKYVAEAIESILNQTYTNFEFIIVNDGSKDKSLEIIQEYMKKDKRIVLIDRENKGLPYSLNEGVSIAKGEYIARMDADDISLPSRFEKQLKYMQENNLDNSKLSFGLASDMMNTEETINKADKNGLIYGKANPFNGTFLHKSVMEKCGFIKKEMFIWGDETEYFLRINQTEFDYATTCNVKYFHPESKTVMQSALFGLLNVPTKPEKLEMNYYRNIGYINGKYGKVLNIKFLIRYFLFFISKGQFGKFIKFMKYFFDGRNDTYKLPKFN